METNRLRRKKFVRYLIPSMLAMALVAVYTFTDTFVVGRKLGSVALGAMGVCTPVITVSFALGFLFGMGGGALYSIRMGQNDKDGANRIFTTSFVTSLSLGIVLAVLLNIFMEPFAYFLGADSENIGYVIPYLRCLLVYIPGFMTDVFFVAYMKNDGHPNVAMVATVVGTGLNVALDFLFVFGFDWGMFGAAFATCLCSGISMAINILFAVCKKLNIVPKIKNFTSSLIARIIKNGFSVFVLESSSGIVTFFFIMQATKLYGNIGSSVYTIIMNWSLICFNLIMGIAQAAQPLISLSRGENDLTAERTYRKYAMISSLIAGIIFIAIGYGVTDGLISVFAVDSQELVSLTAESFRFYIPAFAIMGIGIVIGIYFESVEAPFRSMLIMLSRGMVLPVAGAFLLPLLFGNKGLWLSVPLSEALTSIAAVVILIANDKKLKYGFAAKSIKSQD